MLNKSSNAIGGKRKEEIGNLQKLLHLDIQGKYVIELMLEKEEQRHEIFSFVTRVLRD